MTGVRVQGEEPVDASADATDDAIGTDDAIATEDDAVVDDAAATPELTPAELAALKAAKAAKKAEKAQRKAEKARRLAAEYALQPAGTTAADTDTAPGQDVAAERAATPEQPSSSKVPLLVAAVVTVVCLALAITGLVVYLSGKSSGGGSSEAGVRDTVLLSARQDITVLNTLDYRDVDAGLQRWADASTGTLHQQITSATAAEKKQILAGQTVTTAKVLDAAVMSLDTGNGSATVIASIELTKQPSGKSATTQRERLRAVLTRVGTTWKISSLGPVGVTVP